MDKKEKGYKESLVALDKLEKMTNEEIINVAKELVRVVSVDRKYI